LVLASEEKAPLFLPRKKRAFLLSFPESLSVFLLGEKKLEEVFQKEIVFRGGTFVLLCPFSRSLVSSPLRQKPSIRGKATFQQITLSFSRGFCPPFSIRAHGFSYATGRDHSLGGEKDLFLGGNIGSFSLEEFFGLVILRQLV